MFIRKANKEDIDELSKLRVKQQKDDWGNEYTDKMNLEEKTKDYLRMYLNNTLEIFVAVDNKIISTCGIQEINMLPQCNDNGKIGYICSVFTLYEYRHRGIQKELFKQVINYAKEKGICELQLETDNSIAIELYKQQGFFKNDLSMIMDLK